MAVPDVAIDVAEERARVVAAALAWCGTPFHWGARVPGAGVDCGHLVTGAFEAAGVLAVGAVTWAATPDWYLHQDAHEPWEDALAAQFAPVSGAPALGDVVTFAVGRARHAHGGVVVALDVAGVPTVCHADRGTGVTLDALTPTAALTPRVAGVWRLRRWAEA